MVPLFDGKKNLTHYVGIQSDITIEKKLVKEKSELNAMQTTLQTVNDIVFNFMNTLQLVKLHLEEDPSTNSEIIGEFDLALNQTLSKLKQLNALE